MTIGGLVICVEEILHEETREHLVKVTCQNQIYRTDIISVYTRPAIELPVKGDEVWWQGSEIMWSRVGRFSDRRLPKIGNSFPEKILIKRKETCR